MNKKDSLELPIGKDNVEDIVRILKYGLLQGPPGVARESTLKMVWKWVNEREAEIHAAEHPGEENSYQEHEAFPDESAGIAAPDQQPEDES